MEKQTKDVCVMCVYKRRETQYRKTEYKLYIHKNKKDNQQLPRREKGAYKVTLSLHSLTETPTLSLESWEGENLN